MYIYLHTVDLCELTHRHNKKVGKIKKKTWNSSAQNATGIVNQKRGRRFLGNKDALCKVELKRASAYRRGITWENDLGIVLIGLERSARRQWSLGRSHATTPGH